MKPRALDLFCKAGGVTRGLQLAGFEVWGVDIKPQPKYVGNHFVQADALNPPFDLRSFDFIWASPPCQAHSTISSVSGSRSRHVDLIPQTRAMLKECGMPYCIENVVGAPLHTTIYLCGTMFDLKTDCGAELQRHRLFESSFMMLQPECRHGHSNDIGVTGHGPHNWANDKRRTITITGNTPQQNVVKNKVRRTFTVNDARKAMGIDWMAMAELSQAIPPAYSEYIGRQAMNYIRGRIQ